MTIKLVQFTLSRSEEKPVGPVDMRKTRVCMNTRAEVFAADTRQVFWVQAHKIKANKEAISWDHRGLLKNAPETAWLQWVKHHWRVKVAVWCEVSCLATNIWGKSWLAGAPYEVNAATYTGSASYRSHKQLLLPLHHLALARMCLLQEMSTDHVRPVGSLGGAPRRVHRRHEAGRKWHAPRCLCIPNTASTSATRINQSIISAFIKGH